MSSEIIMHCYDASPFTQKALRMLGIKRLAWRWVETPMMPPKDALVALTGGYRGTPVMQVGRHVYIDSQLIARELERRFPTPSLYPGGHAAIAHMLVKWSDAMFRNGLTIAIEKTSSAWPEPFLDDRRYLFPDVDFAAAAAEGAHARSQFRAHASLMEEQLRATGAYLLGAAPGLADIQAHVFIVMARAYYPDVAAELFAGLERLAAWEQRMQAIGEGQREPIAAEAALAECRASRAPIEGTVVAEFGGALRAGMRVEVAPDDTRRGGVVGELVHLDRDTVVLRRSHAACGEVAVHFPRLGYRVNAS